MKLQLDPTILREALSYDHETGALHWRKRPLSHFETEAICRSWNKRYAGKGALTSQWNGYRGGSVSNVRLSAHRVIWAMATGEWPEQVDHINGDGSDNRLANLRAVTNAENLRNAARHRNNKSGVTGVFFYNGKWIARIGTPPAREELGSFKSFDAAVQARKFAERRLGYHPNHGRANARYASMMNKES